MILKKIYYYLILAFISIPFLIWVYFFSYWDVSFKNLLVINVVILFLRKPMINLMYFFFKKRFYQIIISIIVNIIWSFFIFWFLSLLSPELTLAIISFLIISISLNLRKIVNNIASGVLLLGSEQFEVGDLIETNGIQGIVEEINLNYTKIREFDGVQIIIPNSNVYGSKIIKFTHEKINLENIKKKRMKKLKKLKKIKEYTDLVSKILSVQVKFTKYVKEVEILGKINPETLKDRLMKVFKKYEKIFGESPDYVIDMTRYGRVRLKLYIKTTKPILVLNYCDSLLRDIVYEVYNEIIYDGWGEYKKNKRNKISERGEK